MLVNYNENKLEISNTKRAGKTQNIWRLNNILQNNIQIKKKVSRELKNLKLIKIQPIKLLAHSKNST